MRDFRLEDKMTPEMEKGFRFEIWLEELLREQPDSAYKPRRNVTFKKGGVGGRQVDIMYKIKDNGTIYHAMIEAKYSSNGRIPNKLRSDSSDKSGIIVKPCDTQIKELVDRYLFIEKYFFPFNHVFLVTNGHFDDEVNKLAPTAISDYKKNGQKKGIIVVEGPQLAVLDKKRGGDGNIEKSIAAIDLDLYINWSTAQYINREKRY